MDTIKTKFETMKKESGKLQNEIRQKSLTYVLASFGLVAGLAWNEAIKALIEYAFPLQKNTLLAKFGYAFLMTLVVVFISIYLTRFFKNKEE
jgi:hypothetical protein